MPNTETAGRTSWLRRLDLVEWSLIACGLAALAGLAATVVLGGTHWILAVINAAQFLAVGLGIGTACFARRTPGGDGETSHRFRTWVTRNESWLSFVTSIVLGSTLGIALLAAAYWFLLGIPPW